MGSPQSPDATQYAELEKASELVPETLRLDTARRGMSRLAVSLQRQGVALVVLQPDQETH
jgi:xylan 1,4-beta-xylosidase